MTSRFRLTLLSGLFLAVGAHGQTFSSFQSITGLTGVTVDQLTNLNYNVSLSAGATMDIGATTYDITQIFGFYELSSTDALGSPAGSGFSGWKFTDKTDTSGEIAGWEHSSNNGRMNPGDTVEFKYTKLTPSGDYGFHFSYTPVGGGNTNTGFFTAAPVPEPSSYLALGGAFLGLLGLRRRRRA